jgi:hypothetical protein
MGLCRARPSPARVRLAYGSMMMVASVVGDGPEPTREACPCTTPPNTRPVSIAMTISRMATGNTTLATAEDALPPSLL